MQVAAILKGKGARVVSVRPGDSIAQVAGVLSQHRIGSALVRDEAGRIHGIVSERDLVRGIAGQGAAALAEPVSGVMTRDLVTVGPQEEVVHALALMTDRRVRHLPVLEEGRLVGLVSIGDLVKARIEEAEHEAAELKAYVAASG